MYHVSIEFYYKSAGALSRMPVSDSLDYSIHIPAMIDSE